MEFSRPYRVLRINGLTKSQRVLPRWKQASWYIFATQVDAMHVKTKNKFSSDDSDIEKKPKVLVSGPLLNTCTSIFDVFYLLTGLFRTQNGLDCI